MTILTREQIDAALRWYTPLPNDGDIPEDLAGVFAAACAYHDLHDAVLAELARMSNLIQDDRVQIYGIISRFREIVAESEKGVR